MILFIKHLCQVIYVFVDYLKKAFKYTPHSLYIQNTYCMTMDKCANHHKISLIDLKLDKYKYIFGVLIVI